jgi:23S rRNA (guanosine2251-2'-O)-methyltransferase
MHNDQIIYGVHPVEELLRSRLTSVDHVYFEKGKKGKELFELMKLCRKERLSYNLIPEVRLCHLTGTTRHQGIAASCSVLPYCSVEQLHALIADKRNPLLVLPASIEDPGNLGAIIRSSAALGADALLLERKHTAPLTAAVAKSSAGMIEHIPILKPKNLEALVVQLIDQGFSMIGAEMNKGDHPRSCDFKGSLILVLGGEHRGIPPYLAKRCTGFVSIPMSQKVQSLNVSATTAILLYEVASQRGSRQC